MQDTVKYVFKLDKDKRCYILKKVKAKTAKHLDIPKIYDGKYVVEICKRAFCKCHMLKSITLPDSIMRIDEHAFSDCAIESVTVPKNLADIGTLVFDVGARRDCAVHCLDGDIVYSVTIDGIVYGSADGKSYYVKGVSNDGIENAVILNSIAGKPVTRIDSDAFSGSEKILSVVIPEGITEIGESAFDECSELTDVTFPKSLKKIGPYAFGCCFELDNIILPDGLTEIGYNAFCYCDELVEITVPGSVGVVPESCFHMCDELKRVILGDGINEIQETAFSENESLREATLPASLKSIGDGVFSDCTKLVKIVFGGTVREWEAVEKGRGWDENTGDYTVVCADGFVSKSGRSGSYSANR